MPTPIMVTAGTTVTGDIITGTAPTFLVMGMPVATLTSPVAGAACTGVLASSTAVTFLINGLPAANITAMASGVNTVTGVPVTTCAMATAGVTFIC